MIHLGDAIEVMRSMPEASIDAVVTDPPYALTGIGRTLQMKRNPSRKDYGPNQRRKSGGFMGKSWDAPEDGTPIGFQAWCTEWGREALRVTKPGGYLLAFGGTRTHHRLVCGLEDAGWIIRDELDWIYACLSDDTEILTDLGWVRYNRANDAKLAAAFDSTTGKLQWQRIRRVHRYDHDGPMVEVGPSLVTLNHRVILDAQTASVPRLPRLWDELPAGVGLGEEGQGAVVLPSVQRQTSDPRSPVSAGSRVERGATAMAPRENDGLRESGLEGRRYRVQEARELLWGSIRARTGLGEADGPEGRVRDGAPSPARRALRLLARAFGVREPREPRPDRQPPREPDALAGQSDPQAVRVGQGDRGDGLPPGDTPRLVDYAGVVWCITVPSGAFVARRRGVAFVTGNSGFPKGKANLKPAHEPIVLARKPGPLRPLAIDECRIDYVSEADRPTQEEWNRAGSSGQPGANGYAGQFSKGMKDAYADGKFPVPSGRWPSNLLLQDPELFDTANPGVVGSGAVTRSAVDDGWVDAEKWHATETILNDGAGYSRFFLIPKSARADREPVLRGQLEERRAGVGDDRPSGDFNQRLHPRQTVTRENLHPTVKPVDLMRHLVRLVTPTGGTVLDPFLGSGSTAIAAEMEGFPWIGIEKEPEYVAIAEARLNGVQRGLGLDVPAPTRQIKTNNDGIWPDRDGYDKGEDYGLWAKRMKEPPEEAA